MHSRKILLVDDEKSILKALARILGSQGQIIQAGNGIEALAKLKEENWQIDLVITDVKMPQMDGLQLIEQIKQDGNGLPIIVISGHYDIAPPPDIPIIKKPWDPDELICLVQQMLNKTRV